MTEENEQRKAIRLAAIEVDRARRAVEAYEQAPLLPLGPERDKQVGDYQLAQYDLQQAERRLALLMNNMPPASKNIPGHRVYTPIWDYGS